MITLIGDLHGNLSAYDKIVRIHEHTLQVGDFGLSNAWNKLLYSDIDPDKHKIIGGNHDDWNWLTQGKPAHYLGRYGFTELNTAKFFFVSGGYSIDQWRRTSGFLRGDNISWYWNEEASLEEMINCLDSYKYIKPDIVISHDCPVDVSNIIGSPTNLMRVGGLPANFTSKTQELLQLMFDFHQPDRWFFGHYHKSFNKVINGCKFRCLDIEETFKLG